MARRYVSGKVILAAERLENDFERADLEILGLDHGGASFEGRVFLGNPDADADTATTPESGYAGSFHVFGHGGCFGDAGHCAVKTEAGAFDTRPPHALTPADKRLRITHALRRVAGDGGEFVVTIVPVVTGATDKCDVDDVLHFRKLQIVTYD